MEVVVVKCYEIACCSWVWLVPFDLLNSMVYVFLSRDNVSVINDTWYIMNLMRNELKLNLWDITVDEVVKKRRKWHRVWCWEPLWFCPLRCLWAWVWLFWRMSHTHPFNGPLSGTTRVGQYRKGKNQSGFYWSKRQWVAVASAGPYASLQLAPDR